MRKHLRWLLPLLAIVVLGGVLGLYLWKSASNHPGTQAVKVTKTAQTTQDVADEVPPSTASLKNYTNNRYQFLLSLPEDWPVHEDSADGQTIITIAYQIDVDDAPDDMPLQIICQANPQGLNAQQWFLANNTNEASRGYQQINGNQAYVSTGGSEIPYAAYTLTTAQSVCVLYAFTDLENQQPLIQHAVTSFAW